MSSTIVIKAAGLATSANDLERPDGSLSEASNIIVKRDGIMEPRRGYALYGSQLPLVNERVKQLATYLITLFRTRAPLKQSIYKVSYYILPMLSPLFSHKTARLLIALYGAIMTPIII
jgi:hypothetical protein